MKSISALATISGSAGGMFTSCTFAVPPLAPIQRRRCGSDGNPESVSVSTPSTSMIGVRREKVIVLSGRNQRVSTHERSNFTSVMGLR